MSDEADSILIAGAGCAGLSLAMHLTQNADFRQRIVIVEPRRCDEYSNDRTWSGFATRPHLFSGLASHKWKTWRCKNSKGEHTSKPGRYSYETIRATDYYKFCFDTLSLDPRVEIYFGCGLADSADGSYSIVDRAGQTTQSIRPSHLFDSRPERDRYYAGDPDDVILWQQFAGVEVEMDRDAFDPGVATLMDFDLEQGNAIRFLYVLPYSKRRALIESTVFSHFNVPFAELKKDVETYLGRAHGGNSWSLSRCETGRIPMSTAAITTHRTPRTTRIGLSGGLARPSTGYAFASIHEHSRQIAMDLHAGRSIRNRRQSQFSQVLDRIFLSYLAKNPGESAGLFLRISQRTNADRFARFMMDTSSLADKLAVIMSMPKLPFILEAWHSRTIWLLRGRRSRAAYQSGTLNSEVRL